MGTIQRISRGWKIFQALVIFTFGELLQNAVLSLLLDTDASKK